MAAPAPYGSAEHRRKLSEAVRRANARRRRIESVRPEHVNRWIRSGVVARELQPTLDARGEQAAQMVEDLGGDADVSQMQRGTLEVWERAMVIADVETLAFLTGKRDQPDKILSALNTARNALVAVGLERRAREVPSLQDYLRQRAAENSPHRANSSSPDSQAGSGEDRGSKGQERIQDAPVEGEPCA